jgi:hypothetical protein
MLNFFQIEPFFQLLVPDLIVFCFYILNVVGFTHLFSIKLHHGGSFSRFPDRSYLGGKVNYIDLIDIEKFSIHELDAIMLRLDYTERGKAIYYHYLEPGSNLDFGLHALGNDSDVLSLAKHVPMNKVIHVYTEHGTSTVHTYFSTTANLRIEEITDEVHPAPVPGRQQVQFGGQMLQLQWHQPGFEVADLDYDDINVDQSHNLEITNSRC